MSASAPPPAGIMPEGERSCRVRHVVLGVNAAIAPDLAQFARLDHFARQAQHGVAEIVETDLRLDAGAFRSLSHFPGVRCERG